MKNGKFGFGIIGCGGIAGAHINAIKATPEAELVAVCDIIEDKGRKFGMDHGGVTNFYKNYLDLVKDPAVDIVCICTPSGLHGDGVIAAAQAGKAILCEKPLDISRDRMSEMIDAVDKAKVKMGCVFQLRTYANTIKVRNAIAKGILGKMTLADAYLKDYRSRAYYASADWRGTWALDGGGCLMNQGVHGVDQLLWMTGADVDRVFARADHLVRDIEVEDTCVANLQFTNGAFGAIVATTSCNPGETRRWEIHGDNGSICLTGQNITRWATAPIGSDEMAKNIEFTKEASEDGITHDPMALSMQGHTFLVNDLIQAIKEDREPYVNGHSARKAVDLILSIYESARTGKDVKVPHY
ncbi:MAG TPA: Gfo/Idh/MocA family oxidoreductase [Lentisphaeria bacterium]|nr:Gfo/Idh/MocA family oxidoreductase [Lentisphaeria bacterium]